MGAEPAAKAWAIGDRVRLAIAPPYFKTADSMPMLRPAGVIAVGTEGLIQGARLADTWVVRFAAGVFLVDGKYLESLTELPAETISLEATPPAPSLPAEERTPTDRA